jgi:hypothetical protein
MIGQLHQSRSRSVKKNEATTITVPSGDVIMLAEQTKTQIRSLTYRQAPK